MLGILLASILVSPATDGYFTDELLSLDQRREKIVQMAQKPDVNRNEVDNKIKQLLALVEKYKRLENDTQAKNRPYIKNADGSISSLDDAFFNRYQEIRHTLNAFQAQINQDTKTTLDLTSGITYTPESLNILIQQHGLDEFLLGFKPQTFEDAKAYLWLGDIAFEQGAFRQAAWAYERLKHYFNPVNTNEILTEIEQERLKHIDESIALCFKLIQRQEAAAEDGIIKRLLKRFKFSDSIDISSKNQGSFRYFNTVESEICFAEKRFSLIHLKSIVSKTKVVLKDLVTQPNNSLIVGNRIFIPIFESDQSVGILVFDKKTFKPVTLNGEPLQRRIAYLHDIFTHTPKHVSAAVDEKNLYLLVEDTIFILDNFSLDILEQRTVVPADLKRFQDDDDDVTFDKKVALYFSSVKFRTMMVNLSNHASEDSLDTEALSYLSPLPEYDNQRALFTNLWMQYPNFTLKSKIIQSLYARTKVSNTTNFKNASEALALLMKIDSPEIWTDLKNQFENSNDIEQQLLWYLTLALDPPDRLIKPRLELPDELNTVVNEYTLKYGIRHKNPDIRRASLQAIQRTWLNSKSFARLYAREIIKSIQLEPDPKIKADYLTFTRFIENTYILELSDLYEDILKNESKITKTAVLHVLSYSRRSITSSLEQVLMKFLPKNKENISPFQTAVYSAISGTISPRPHQRLDQLLEAIQETINQPLTDSNTDQTKQELLDCIGSTTDSMQNLKLNLTPEQTTKLFSVLEYFLHEPEKHYSLSWICISIINQGWFKFEEVRGYLFQALSAGIPLLRAVMSVFSKTYLHAPYTKEELTEIFDIWSISPFWASEMFEEFCSEHVLEFYTYLVDGIKASTKSKGDRKPLLLDRFYSTSLEVIQLGPLATRQEAVRLLFSEAKEEVTSRRKSETTILADGLLKIATDVEPELRAEFYMMFLELPNPDVLINTLKAKYNNEDTLEHQCLNDLNALYLAKEKLTPSKD